ncbi:hypothetical protein C7S17_6987 [Burkholderia thailandensis]|nr:hypothetical protein [Burkholderia thailandensis]
MATLAASDAWAGFASTRDARGRKRAKKGAASVRLWRGPFRVLTRFAGLARDRGKRFWHRSSRREQERIIHMAFINVD